MKNKTNRLSFEEEYQNRDYSSLKLEIKSSVVKHIALLQKNNKNEEFYAYSLYSSDGFPHFGLVANCKSHLKTKEKEGDVLYDKYCADEWSHWEDYSCFDKANETIESFHQAFEDAYDEDRIDDYDIAWNDNIEKIFDTVLESLSELKKEGKFDWLVNKPNSYLVIWSSDPDEGTFTLVKKSVKKLNSTSIINEFNSVFDKKT